MKTKWKISSSTAITRLLYIALHGHGMYAINILHAIMSQHYFFFSAADDDGICFLFYLINNKKNQATKSENFGNELMSFRMKVISHWYKFIAFVVAHLCLIFTHTHTHTRGDLRLWKLKLLMQLEEVKESVIECVTLILSETTCQLFFSSF